MNLQTLITLFGVIAFLTGMVLMRIIDRYFEKRTQPENVGDIVFVNPDDELDENPSVYCTFSVYPSDILEMDYVTMRVRATSVTVDPQK